MAEVDIAGLLELWSIREDSGNLEQNAGNHAALQHFATAKCHILSWNFHKGILFTWNKGVCCTPGLEIIIPCSIVFLAVHHGSFHVQTFAELLWQKTVGLIYILAIDKSYSFLLGHIGMIIILIIYVPWFLIYIIIASILLLLLAIPKKDPGYPTVVCCRMMLGHPAGTARVVPDWPWHSLRARAVPKKDTFFWTPNSQIAINIPDLTCFPLFSIVFLLYAICQILILVVFLWYGLIWEILLWNIIWYGKFRIPTSK
jgi:hypothetical protein